MMENRALLFKNKNFSNTILLVILIIGLALRLWQLGHVPISPDWDEVALGYSAYSILHTGHDEFGNFLPAVLRSFGDYKPALYSYLAIPSIALFGLTVFAVRLPSVVMGVLGIWLLYLFVKELVSLNPKPETLNPKQAQMSKEEGLRQQLAIGNWQSAIPLVAAFLIAISPWQIQFSRTAFETNTGLTFNLLIGLFFLKGLKRPWMLLPAALFAGLNLSVYQSERVFTPLLVLALVIIYRNELLKVSKKYLLGSVLVGLIAVLPMLLFIFTHANSLARIQNTVLFSQQTQAIRNAPFRLVNDKAHHDLIGEIIDNRRVVFAREIIGAYLSHFNLNWLFLEGDNPRHHAPGMGLLYMLDLPFLFIGIYQFVFGKFSKKTKYLIFSWLLLAPVPAAVTFDVPHAVRAMNMLPMLLFFEAIGYVSVFHFINKYKSAGTKQKVLTFIFYALFFVSAAFNFTYYLNQYFVQQNYFNAARWQYGYAKIIPQVERVQKHYKSIVVSNKAGMNQSYMFFLFYLRYPPQYYQQLVAQGKNLTSDKQFGKYEFRTFNWNTARFKKDTLYVGSAADFPSNIVAKKTIYYPDGKPAMMLVDPKNNL